MEPIDDIGRITGSYENSGMVGCGQCAQPLPTKYLIIGIIFYYILFSFLITLGFYLVYVYKKDKHPWRHALKRSWPWWIVLLLISALIYWLCLRFVFD